MARSSATMLGNAALCEPIDLQSDRPSMNAATFYKHSRLRFYILIYSYLTVNFLITPATETLFYKFLELPSSKTNVSLARAIKKFTIMSHPSHTGLLSYTSTGCCTQVRFVPRPLPALPVTKDLQWPRG